MLVCVEEAAEKGHSEQTDSRHREEKRHPVEEGMAFEFFFNVVFPS